MTLFFLFKPGLLISSLIFNKLLKLHDCVIGAFASFWDTMAVLGYFLATKNWQLYLSKFVIRYLKMLLHLRKYKPGNDIFQFY